MADSQIEPTSSGFGAIRFTEEQRQAIRAERERNSRDAQIGFRNRYGRDEPSDRERRVAAQLRVRADKKLGRETPTWIRDLAGDLKGHTFTRRTYRVARKRALRDISLARNDWFAHPHLYPGQVMDAIEQARRIVARGRREKGMWK